LKAINNNIIDFVKSSVSTLQFGFLKGRSSLQQLLIFWNTIINVPQTDDFRKAFDSVSHNELLLKLWRFGITGSLWMLFKAYLTDSHQYVSVGHSASGIYLSSLGSLRAVFYDHFISHLY
jgi:ribonuclease P/MRP protein subunit RPP40